MKAIHVTLVALMLCSTIPVFSQDLLPIEEIHTSAQFTAVIDEIDRERNALYVFDIDNTLLITNDNGFGSDWWYSQTKTNPSLKLGINNQCLFGVLTPLFYAVYETSELFAQQAELIAELGKGKSRTIALTSREYSSSVSTSTELALKDNKYQFLTADSAYLAKDVVMLNGVIYTKGQNKGEVLMQYLQDKPYEKIFYFDDSLFKVEDVQEAFSGSAFDISLYHMKVAPKVTYTAEEVAQMQEQLCNLIQTVNRSAEDKVCSCSK